MAKKGLLSQFTSSWIRQMGRESAHTAYGDITGKNTITSKGSVDGFKPLPGFWDYVKLILALVFLPAIGPIWAFFKGCIRAYGKKILFYEVYDQNIYKMDRRYSDGKRYVGTQKAKQKIEGLKANVPEKDVKRFNIHAYIYIFLSIATLALQVVMYKNYQMQNAVAEAQYQSYATWHTVTITDDFTKTSTCYDMVYSTVEDKVKSDVILMKKDGKYLLLSKWSNDVDYDYQESAAVIEVKTNRSMKTVKLKRINDSYKDKKYLTPENKEIDFMEVLVFPKGVVPESGIMQIRMKEKIYSFNLDKEGPTMEFAKLYCMNTVEQNGEILYICQSFVTVPTGTTEEIEGGAVVTYEKGFLNKGPIVAVKKHKKVEVNDYGYIEADRIIFVKTGTVCYIDSEGKPNEIPLIQVEQ